MNSQKCILCDREVVKQGYCRLHARAYENIILKYEYWRKALDLTWKEYLSGIAENSLTGEWARQVAEHLVQTEAKK